MTELWSLAFWNEANLAGERGILTFYINLLLGLYLTTKVLAKLLETTTITRLAARVAPLVSERWHSASYQHRRHKRRYRQHQEYAPHAMRILLL